MTTNKAFLSHQSSDKPIVESIGTRLRASGVDVFLDAWDISVGDSIPDEIEKALLDSNIFIYALSPTSVQSKWVKAEYHSYLFRKINDHNLRIIPILLADCDKPPLIAPLKHIDFRKFKLDRGETQAAPIEELLRTIFRSSVKPSLGIPHPALASFEVYFQKMKNLPVGSAGDRWELGLKNVTDSPLLNFTFALEFTSPVDAVDYDFERSTANMTGGEGLSLDKTRFHWLGNQIAEDGGWAVFLIRSKFEPVIARFCSKLLGRSNDANQLFLPDQDGLSEIVLSISSR